MKANYHTHTYFCGHATGNAEDYVKEAIKNGLQVIGISDHAPNDRVNDYHVRMKPEKLDQYIEEINDAKAKYGKDIKIYSGLEVEFFYDHEEYYKELKEKVEYLVHGQHYISETKEMDNLTSGFALRTVDDIYTYSEYLVDAMESGHFNVFAHPDLYMCGYKEFDEHAEKVAHIICKKAEETNSILEYNGNGYRRGATMTPLGIQPLYPRMEFWNIVKTYNIKTILGSDCHSPEIMYDETIKEAEEVYQKLGLKYIEFLDIK